MRKRNQIPDKYKWDLTKFVESDEKWYELLEELKLITPKIEKFKGKLDNPKVLLDYYKLSEEYFHKSQRLGMYASNHSNVDLANSKYIEMLNMLEGVANDISVASSFYSPEMLSYPEEYIHSLINDKRFAIHKFSLKELLRSKPYVLSEKEEKILSASGAFAGEFYSIYNTLTNVNLKFNDVLNKDNKPKPLNESKYSVYMKSSDRVLRKNAFKELYKQYKSFEDTIASNYIGHLKSDWFYAKTEQHKSVLEQHFFPDNINPQVYEILVSNIHKNLPLLHKYYFLKGKLLNLKDFTYYDMYASNVSLSKKIEFPQAMNVLKDALSVLGDDYLELLDKCIEEKWIDIYPNENKRSGAYQSDYYGETPVVLLNYENQISDVFTLAHELGHAMHSYYSNKAQPYTTASYTIFLAEVASTVNEIILLKHFYNLATTKKEKVYYLNEYLHMFKSTVFRQVMFSEFEDFAHKLVEQNLPISKNVLTEKYASLNKQYQGKYVKHAKEIEYEWLRIPHFYSSYYVYKYATGFITAVSLASEIIQGKEGALQNYKNFLSSGGSNYSVEILKQAGVNLETNTPHEIAFAEMKWAITELEKLV